MILGFLAMTLGQFFEAAYLGILGIDALAAVTFTFPVMMALGAATRGIGAAAHPGLVISVGSILQDAIGPFFIFGWLGLWALGVGGVEGAAWAFVIARSVSFLLAAHWFVIRERMIRASLRRFAMSARAILHVGIPAMTSNLIEPLSAAIVTRLLAGFGTAVVAGYGVAARIDAVAFMVVIGFSSSAAPLVGQNWGAGRFDRVDRTLSLCYRYCLIWSLIAGATMWLGGRWFVSLINDDPDAVAAATAYLYLIPITIGFSGMLNAANGAFNALSKPFPPLALSMLRMIVFYVPLALIASHFLGYVGIFAAAAVANVALGLWARAWNWRTVVREWALLERAAA